MHGRKNIKKITQSRQPFGMKTKNFVRWKSEENIPHKAFEQ